MNAIDVVNIFVTLGSEQAHLVKPLLEFLRKLDSQIYSEIGLLSQESLNRWALTPFEVNVSGV